MSVELERLAKSDSPRLPAVFAKALDAGEIHVDHLRRLLKLRAREYRHESETTEQAYSKAFTGLSPRDTVGAELFAKLVTLEKANAPKPVAHFDGGDGEPDLDGDDAAGDGKSLEEMARAHMKAHPEITSKTQAVQAVLATPRGRAIAQRDRKRAGIG